MNRLENKVSPELINTEILADLPDDIKNSIESTLPMKRMGNADEIAKTVLFLASDNASYITVADILVDGTYNLKL